MASDRTRTRREDGIVTLYQVDPAFYRKILSRNSSGDCSDRLTVCGMPGRVPFAWEMQPGEPRDSQEDETTVLPIKLPPAVRGLNMPRPSFPPSGPKAFLLKKLKKMESIKNIQIKRLSRSIQRLKPEISQITFKECFTKTVGKLERNRFIHIRKKAECKSRKDSKGDFDDYDTNESDGLVFFYSESDDFTPSSINSTTSSSSPSPSPSQSSSSSFRSAKISNLFDLSKRVEKWKKYMKQ